MKRLNLTIVICLLLMPSHAGASDGAYGYPIQDAYYATILGTPENLKFSPSEEISIKRLTLDIIPGLHKPDVFYYDEGLRCTLARQDKKSPLVFIIAGTGAGDQSQKALAMMKALYEAGYHVIAVPSPTHPNFIISAASGHIPGYLEEDAADLYHVMEKAWDEVKGNIEVTEFYLTGYSLGGTHAAFVARLDEERKVFNFRKVLMVNPSVNLFNSLTRIENLLDRIPGGPGRIGAYLNIMMAKLTDFYHRGDFVEINTDFLYAALRSKIFTEDEAGGLIGVSFRVSLAGLIFASDVMTNGGYVVSRNRVLTGADPLGDYFVTCIHLSFLDYFDEFFMPYMQKKRPGITRGEVIDLLGLQSIEGYLKSTLKIGAITNENDFILSPEEIDYLRKLFGERAIIYPRGGHMGNLEYRDNMVEFINFFDR